MPGYVTPDISFVSIVNLCWQGAPDMQRAHHAVFDRICRSAVFSPASLGATAMRIITPEAVLLTSQVTPPNPTDVPEPASSSAHAMFTSLLVERQGRWFIAFGQNTPVAATAAADPSKMAQKRDGAASATQQLPNPPCFDQRGTAG